MEKLTKENIRAKDSALLGKSALLMIIAFISLMIIPFVLAVDSDSDGVADNLDNCPTVANPRQENSDNVINYVGQYHTCILKNNGNVGCWGWFPYGDNYGQANNYTGGDAIEVSTGDRHTCVLKNNGNVHCYGWNLYGQANDYNEGDAIGVSAGDVHTCILRNNGNVYCYGLGNDGRSNPYTGGDAIEVSAGNGHNCVLKNNGNVECWGANSVGQANNYTGGDAIEVSAGSQHTCVLKSNGNVHCYGENSYGQSNDYNGGDAIAVAAGWPVDDVNVGNGGYTCILKNNGNVECYGYTPYGRTDPYTGGDAIGVSVGYYHTCVLKNNGNVVCYGPYPFNYIGGDAVKGGSGKGDACDCDADRLCTAQAYCSGHGTPDPDCGGFKPPQCTDIDNDGIKAEGGLCGTKDNCPNEKNPDQTDMDADSMGDVCDNCPACKGAGCCVEQYSTGENLAPDQHLVINTGDAVIDIPAGSVSKNVSVSITKGVEKNFKICIPDAGECATVVSSYTIGKISQTFTNDYTLKLSYGDFSACAEPGVCEIWYNDGIRWNNNEFGIPEVEDGFLVIHGDHFSEYAIVTKISSMIAVADMVAKPGDSINLWIILRSAASGGFQFDLSSQVLSFLGYNLAQEISNANVAFNNLASPLRVSVLADINQPIPANQGKAIDLSCTVDSNSQEGVYALDISNTVVANEKGAIMNVPELDGTLTIDDTPPIITLQNVPSADDWRNSAAYINIQCEDALSGCTEIKYGLAEDSGSCVADQIYQGSVEVDDESWLCYTAKDAAGNSASGSELIDYFNFDAPNTIATFAGVACNY
jgi:hypothetical protein